MPMHWSIEDGQTIPLATIFGDDSPHPTALVFSTDGGNTHNQMLSLQCEDGSAYTLTFNRNGLPQGPAVKTEPPPPPAPLVEEAEQPTKRSRKEA